MVICPGCEEIVPLLCAHGYCEDCTDFLCQPCRVDSWWDDQDMLPSRYDTNRDILEENRRG